MIGLNQMFCLTPLDINTGSKSGLFHSPISIGTPFASDSSTCVGLSAVPWEGVHFGCQMVLSKELLDEPYANENARRMAILKQVEADTRKDTSEVGADNAMVSLCGMMAGQGMEAVLTKLNSSPALASRLSEQNGLEFEHISFDKGRLRMVIDNDVVTVRMRLGSFGKDEKISFEGLGSMED